MPPATDTAASGEATPEASNGTVTEPLAEEATTEAADTEPVLLEIIKAGQNRATCRILHDPGADGKTVETANMIGALMKNYTGCDVAVQDTGKDPAKKFSSTATATPRPPL